MLGTLPAAPISARIPVTVTIMVIRHCSLLYHKRHANTKREKIKGRMNHHQNLHDQIQIILPPEKIGSLEECIFTKS